MIVNNPYIIKSVLIFNRKTNPILIVDTKAVLPLSISEAIYHMSKLYPRCVYMSNGYIVL